VWLTGSGWPDIAVGLALSALFLRSAASVLRGAVDELRAAKVPAAPKQPVPISIPIRIQRKS
jgi:Co/Zn/Cd efflux system component